MLVAQRLQCQFANSLSPNFNLQLGASMISRMSIALLICILPSCKTTSGRDPQATSELESGPAGQEIGDVDPNADPIVLGDDSLVDNGREISGLDARKLIRLMKQTGSTLMPSGQFSAYKAENISCWYQLNVEWPSVPNAPKFLYFCSSTRQGITELAPPLMGKPASLGYNLLKKYAPEAAPIPGEIHPNLNRTIEKVFCEFGKELGTSRQHNNCSFLIVVPPTPAILPVQ